MADSQVDVKDAANNTVPVDSRTNSAGQQRQVMVIGGDGDPVAGVTDPSTIPGALLEGVRDRHAGVALNVNANAIQKATYSLVAKPTAVAQAAGATRHYVAMWHTATSTKTVRIRKINAFTLASATAEGSLVEVYYFTAAPTGTAIAAPGGIFALDKRDPAAETTALQHGATALAVSSTQLLQNGYLSSGPATVHAGGGTIYNWDENGETKPITLRAGVLEGISIAYLSNAAVTHTPSIEIRFTEE